MKWLAECVMARRARSLFARLGPHLPASGTIADIGSGTGHNAEEIRRRTALTVREFDVADLHWVGPGPAIVAGNRVPIDDRAFDGLLLLFVLQYPDSPRELLAEACRISRGSVIALQSTYRGEWGRAVLTMREFTWGRLALRVASAFRVVRPVECSLRPRRHFTRAELLQLFDDAGLVVVSFEPAEWPGLRVSRDLYVLETRSS
jgi:SAM-dependent methyltransferase